MDSSRVVLPQQAVVDVVAEFTGDDRGVQVVGGVVGNGRQSIGLSEPHQVARPGPVVAAEAAEAAEAAARRAEVAAKAAEHEHQVLSLTEQDRLAIEHPEVASAVVTVEVVATKRFDPRELDRLPKHIKKKKRASPPPRQDRQKPWLQLQQHQNIDSPGAGTEIKIAEAEARASAAHAAAAAARKAAHEAVRKASVAREAAAHERSHSVRVSPNHRFSDDVAQQTSESKAEQVGSQTTSTFNAASRLTDEKAMATQVAGEAGKSQWEEASWATSGWADDDGLHRPESGGLYRPASGKLRFGLPKGSARASSASQETKMRERTKRKLRLNSLARSTMFATIDTSSSGVGDADRPWLEERSKHDIAPHDLKNVMMVNATVTKGSKPDALTSKVARAVAASRKWSATVSAKAQERENECVSSPFVSLSLLDPMHTSHSLE